MTAQDERVVEPTQSFSEHLDKPKAQAEDVNMEQGQNETSSNEIKDIEMAGQQQAVDDAEVATSEPDYSLVDPALR